MNKNDNMNETSHLLGENALASYNSSNGSISFTCTGSSDEDVDYKLLVLTPANTTVSNEICYLLKNSFPVLITFLFQYFVQIMIPIYFSSKLGPAYLSSCSLAITTFYLTGPVVINGFSTALDTLCSTAFGAHHYQKVGYYYIQCTFILLILLIPSMIFWFNSRAFLKLITDDQQLIDLSSEYLRLMPLVAPAIAIFESSKRFLQSQNKFSAPTKIVLFSMPLSVIINLKLSNLLLHLAPPVSFIITYWLMAVSLVLYIFLMDGYQCLPNKDSLSSVKSLFSDWNQYFKLGIPGILMILSEALAFQILTILSTTFSPEQLAAQSIVSTLASLAFQLPFSVGICCSTRIANIIGGKSSNFDKTFKAILIITIFLSVFNFSWLVIFRKQLALFFTGDANLLNLIDKLSFIIAINQFLDCFNIICAAVLRGQGRQKIGSILSIISYYIIATPFEILFAFKFNLQVFGLWLGLAIGVNFLSVTELFVVCKSNWLKIIEQNHKMV